MRLHSIFCIIFVAPLLCGAADSAKVYQSKDADGNIVFSDMPSAGAEVITVAPTNTANPVEHIPALEASDKQVPPAPPATKLTTSPADVGSTGGDEPEYWIGNDEDDLEGRENRLRDRRPGPEHPIADRPRVQPLPSGVRPASGGAGRR